MIQLYDFETLKLLYSIRSDDYAIKSLKFSRDSSRILDIRASQYQVWDPMVLVRQDTEEELSDTVSISTAPQEIASEDFEDVVLVTSLACYRKSEIFFVGKEDGAVYIHDTKSGAEIQKLFSHADGVAIVRLYFDDEKNLLSSVDSSSRVLIHKLIRLSDTWDVEEACFNHRAGVLVKHRYHMLQSTGMRR
jgi:WD40 repeat protein